MYEPRRDNIILTSSETVAHSGKLNKIYQNTLERTYCFLILYYVSRHLYNQTFKRNYNCF